MIHKLSIGLVTPVTPPSAAQSVTLAADLIQLSNCATSWQDSC